MFDAFPFDEWSNDITTFWTFGNENSAGTYIMTALGVAAMLISLVGFVMMEKSKLDRQADKLRAAMNASG
jgi:hypothetical protein